MTKLSKQSRISAEITRLTEIYSDLDSNSLASLTGLIERAAYMRVTLEDYEADLDGKGYVENFRQSPDLPGYERLRPVASLYNTMNKNYQGVIKLLTDALPEPVAPDAGEEIKRFASGAK